MSSKQTVQRYLAAIAALGCTAFLSAGTFEWTFPISGLFQDPGQWSLTSGAGAAPPGVGDTAVFNENATYTINFASGITASTDAVRMLSGAVTFRRSTTSPATLQLTTGGADLTVESSILRLGDLTLPINVNVGDDTILYNNGTLHVRYGSSLTTDSLSMGNAAYATGTNETLVGSGAASTLHVTGQTLIGRYGTLGQLRGINDSQLTLDGSVFIGGASNAPNSAGILWLSSDADAIVNSSIVVGGGNATSSGELRMTGLNTLAQYGASNLTIGGTSAQGAGAININGGSYMQTGTGLTRVRESGTVITGDGGTYGQLSVKGTLEVDGGVMIHNLSSGLVVQPSTTTTVHNGGSLIFHQPFTIHNNQLFNVTESAELSMFQGGIIGNTTAGTVTIDGAEFQTAGPLELGKAGGFGSLTFTNGAIGDLSPVTYLGGDPIPFASSQMTIEGASQVVSNVTNVWGRGTNAQATLTVTGVGTQLTIQAAQLAVGHPDAAGESLIEVTDGALLSTIDGMGGGGVTRVWPNGELFVDVDSSMDADAEIIVDGGELRVDGVINLLNQAHLDLVSGVISGHGLIQFGGTSSKILVSHGTISPGTSNLNPLAIGGTTGVLTFEDGIVELNSDSVCAIELGGYIAGSGFDRIAVPDAGEIALAGTLDVSLVAGFAPMPGDEFVIITAESGVSGVFDEVNSPTPVDVIYDDEQVTLVVLQSCLGDLVQSATFNPPADGVVDGADLAYLLGEWGRNPGSAADFVDSATFAPPPDGVVDGADLAVLLGGWGVCE